MKSHRLLLLGFWCVAATALACKVPVFRYALERWPVDQYRVVAIVEGKHHGAGADSLSQLESFATSNANVESEVIDLASLSDDELWQLEDYDGSTDTPILQVFYPAKDGKRIKCWEGPLQTDTISKWLQSPLRKTIADDLVGGESAVFLLVDGVDSKQNDQIAEKVERSLAAAADQIKIPEGVIARDQASQYLQKHPQASMDDVLRSDVPLRVSFHLRRLARDDSDESALLSMIHGLVEDRDQPILVPIFGRGRMLDAMNATECDDDVILNACRYMVGECSCTVKALNPGVDLLLAVDWSDKLGQAIVMVDPTSGRESEDSGEPTMVAIPNGDVDKKTEPTASKNPLSGVPVGLVAGAAILLFFLVGANKYLNLSR